MGCLPIKITIISIQFLKILLADSASNGKLSDFEKVSEYSSLNSCIMIDVIL